MDGAAVRRRTGHDSELLRQMVEKLQQVKLIPQPADRAHGYLVSELYGYPYQRNRLMDRFGDQVRHGELVASHPEKLYQDVPPALFSLLPDQEVANLDEKKRAITLEICDMTSGLDCHEIRPARLSWKKRELGSVMTTCPWLPSRTNSTMHGSRPPAFRGSTQSHRDEHREFANPRNLVRPLGLSPSRKPWPSDPQG